MHNVSSRLNQFGSRIEWVDILWVSILLFVIFTPILSTPEKALAFSVLSFRYNKRLFNCWAFLMLLVFLAVFLVGFPREVFYLLEFDYWNFSFLYPPICVFFGYKIAMSIDYEKFMRAFVVVMRFSAVFSLVVFLVINFKAEWVEFLPAYEYGGLTHKTVVVANVLFADGFLVVRNAGFASEPGVYQILLNTALYYCLVRRVVNYCNVILFVSVILTTMSTAGIFIMFLVFLVGIKNIRSLVVFIPFLLVLLAIFYFSGEFSYHVENKLSGSASFEVRISPLLNALNVAMENPFGIGMVKYLYLSESLGIGSWDAYSQTVMRYGWFALVPLLIALACLKRSTLR